MINIKRILKFAKRNSKLEKFKQERIKEFEAGKILQVDNSVDNAKYFDKIEVSDEKHNS